MEYVYVITNPAFPDYCKLGLTTQESPEKRLGNYNTGSPYRDYKLEHYVETHDCKTLERELHLNIKDAGFVLRNEWAQIPVPLAISLLETTATDVAADPQEA